MGGAEECEEDAGEVGGAGEDRRGAQGIYNQAGRSNARRLVLAAFEKKFVLALVHLFFVW